MFVSARSLAGSRHALEAMEYDLGAAGGGTSKRRHSVGVVAPQYVVMTPSMLIEAEGSIMHPFTSGVVDDSKRRARRGSTEGILEQTRTNRKSRRRRRSDGSIGLRGRGRGAGRAYAVGDDEYVEATMAALIAERKMAQKKKSRGGSRSRRRSEEFFVADSGVEDAYGGGGSGSPDGPGSWMDTDVDPAAKWHVDGDLDGSVGPPRATTIRWADDCGKELNQVWICPALGEANTEWPTRKKPSSGCCVIS